MADERNWAWFTTDDGSQVERSWDNVVAGKIPWEEITDEELSKGRLRAGDGSWRYNKQALLPRKLVAEVTRHLKARFDDRLRQELQSLQQVYFDVAFDENVSAADRLRAAGYMMERLIGKVPDKVEVIAEVKPWEGMVEGILQDVPEDE